MKAITTQIRGGTCSGAASRLSYSANLSLGFLAIAFSLCSCAPPLEAPRLSASDIQAARIRERFLPIRSALVDSYAKNLLRRLRPPSLPPAALLVLDSPDRFAYSDRMGNVIVSKGLVQALECEAELAFVLAHEFAHESLGHAGEDDLSEAGRRDFEFAADEAALDYLCRAAYNPLGAISALKHFEDKKRSPGYPAFGERIQALQRLLAQRMNCVTRGTLNTRDFEKFKRSLG